MEMVLNCTKGVGERYKSRHFEYIGYKEFHDIMETFGMISKQIQYCSDTTNRLLNLSRKKVSTKKTASQINQVIKEVVHAFREQLKISRIKLNWELQVPMPVSAAIDPLELNQVLTNIFANAVQA